MPQRDASGRKIKFLRKCIFDGIIEFRKLKLNLLKQHMGVN
jgi:hypothetical protein